MKQFSLGFAAHAATAVVTFLAVTAFYSSGFAFLTVRNVTAGFADGPYSTISSRSIACHSGDSFISITNWCPENELPEIIFQKGEKRLTLGVADILDRMRPTAPREGVGPPARPLSF